MLSGSMLWLVLYLILSFIIIQNSLPISPALLHANTHTHTYMHIHTQAYSIQSGIWYVFGLSGNYSIKLWELSYTYETISRRHTLYWGVYPPQQNILSCEKSHHVGIVDSHILLSLERVPPIFSLHFPLLRLIFSLFCWSEFLF